VKELLKDVVKHLRLRVIRLDVRQKLVQGPRNEIDQFLRQVQFEIWSHRGAPSRCE
jgi:hypothetical protein